MFTILKLSNSTVSKLNINIFNRSITRSSVFGAEHKVNNLEKKFLVWTGKYKTTAEIPTFVPGEVVEKARNKMRIKLANIMMAGTLVACLFMAMSGKRARDRGESVQKENLAWHNQFNEDSKTK